MGGVHVADPDAGGAGHADAVPFHIVSIGRVEQIVRAVALDHPRRLRDARLPRWKQNHFGAPA